MEEQPMTALSYLSGIGDTTKERRAQGERRQTALLCLTTCLIVVLTISSTSVIAAERSHAHRPAARHRASPAGSIVKHESGANAAKPIQDPISAFGEVQHGGAIPY